MEFEESEGEEEMEEEEEPQEIDEFLEKEKEEEEMDEEETSEGGPASSPEWSETEVQESPEIAEVSDEEDEDGEGSLEDLFQSSSESVDTTSVLKVTNWFKVSLNIYSRLVYPNGYATCAWSLLTNRLRTVSFFIYCFLFFFFILHNINWGPHAKNFRDQKTDYS